MRMKRMNLWAVALLVFVLFISGFQGPAFAAEQTATVTKATVSVIGDGGTSLVPDTPVTIEGTENAAQVLEQAAGKSNVAYTHYDGLGDMITGIKGTNADDKHYWSLYINGVAAQIGAQSYTVQNGDSISFRYSDFTPPQNNVSIKVVDDQKKSTALENIAIIGHPTALQLLLAAFGPDKVGLEDTEWGKMIVSINGLAQKGTNYWAFYVNGKQATAGAESYALQPGDEISFQFESWETPADGSGNSTDTGTTTDNGKTTTVVSPITANELNSAIGSVTKYVEKNPIAEWEAIALSQAGQKLPDSYLENVKNEVIKHQGNFRSITDTERYILGILAAGGDPRNTGGYNLVQSVYNGDVTKQGLNGVAYGLIALDGAHFDIPSTAKWTREKLVNLLLEKQNADGGWAWDGSNVSDSDSTAMVLTALAPYKTEKAVKDKTTAAINYLSKQYQDGKIDNSATLSQVVIALSSFGINVNQAPFASDKSNIVKDLLSYQNKDGGFGWKHGDESDAMSTPQGFLGLMAYQHYTQGKGSIYQFKLVPAQPAPVNNGTSTTTKVQQTNQTKGHALPNTASSAANLLVLGALLLFLGTVFYLRQTRLKA